MVLEVWNNLVAPVWEKLVEWLKKIWDESLKGLVKEVLGFIGRVAELFGILWDTLAPVVKKMWESIVEAFRVAIKLIMDIVGPIVQWIIDIVKSIFKVLNGVIDFLVGIFTGDWKRAWTGVKEVFEGVWDAIKATFKMVFNVALGVVEGFINAAIAIINTFIRAINLAIGAINKIPGVNIPMMGVIPDVSIPKLAKGGLAYGPTLAMVGDNKGAAADPEVVAPLSKLQGMLESGSNAEVVALLQAMYQLMQETGRRPVVLEANGTQIAKVTTNATTDVNRRAGRTLATL
jgi:phage-related protein